MKSKNNIDSHRQLEKFSNGTHLLTIGIPKSNTLSILFYFKVGSKYETISINGISHFIEHLLFKGNKKYPNTIDMARKLDEFGVYYNAFTNKETTAYHYKMVSTDPKILEFVCDITFQMFFHSLFRNTDITKERHVVIEEYNKTLNEPDTLFEQIIDGLIFTGHSLELFIPGKPDSLKKIKKTDILEYYKKYYRLDNLIICLVGGGVAEGREIVRKKYNGRSSEIVNLKSIGSSVNILPFVSKFNELKQVSKVYRPLAQNIIYIVCPTFGSLDENKYVHRLITTLLSGGMSSRLFVNIRDKHGLVYSISSNTTSYMEGGFLYIKFSTDLKHTNKCIELVEDEIKKIIHKGFTQRELNINLRSIENLYKMNFEYIENIATFYGEQILCNNSVLSIDEYSNVLKNISLNRINDVFKDIFKNYKVIIYGG